MMHPCSSASMRMVRDTLLSAHTTTQPAPISMAASWLSLRLATMTMSPGEMDFSICSALPEPMMIRPDTCLSRMSPTRTVPSRISTIF